MGSELIQKTSVETPGSFFSQVPRFRAYSIGATRSKWRRKVVKASSACLRNTLSSQACRQMGSVLSCRIRAYIIPSFTVQVEDGLFFFFFFLIFHLDTGDGGVVLYSPFDEIERRHTVSTRKTGGVRRRFREYLDEGRMSFPRGPRKRNSKEWIKLEHREPWY